MIKKSSEILKVQTRGKLRENLVSENFKFFRHEKCEYFPCHKVENTEKFNCLFCYCPLYMLGDKCGGNFKYNDKGIKDCCNCLIPHTEKSFDYIKSKWNLINEMTSQKPLKEGLKVKNAL